VVRRLTFAVPGSLATPTGGYVYDRRLIAELEKLGWQIEVIDLGDGFPWPSSEVLATAQARLMAVPAGRIIIVDGLAFGVLSQAARALCANHTLIALVHHPLALESGHSKQQAENLRASERAALATARRIIVTSAATARHLVTDYAVPTEHIVVARPGNDPVPPAVGNRDGIVHLLSVGAIVPRKGFDVLIAALAALTDLPWQLTIAGDRTRALQTAALLDADIAHHNLGARVTVLGAVPPERLRTLYANVDIFVLASRFEGYGMAYSEAIAHGIPVVGTNVGAIPDTVPAGAGLLVPPDNVDALAYTLRRLMENPGERKKMAAAARAAAAQLPTWRDAAAVVSLVIEDLA